MSKARKREQEARQALAVLLCCCSAVSPVAKTRHASGEKANLTGSPSVMSLNSELPPHMLTIIVENTVPKAIVSV